MLAQAAQAHYQHVLQVRMNCKKVELIYVLGVLVGVTGPQPKSSSVIQTCLVFPFFMQGYQGRSMARWTICLCLKLWTFPATNW